ncbi:hypothetical protein K438DRAFT_2020979 [Mycena galopus ATCC 62051]|nr:hypothetical protein K438DRAFT_2020979 [Mycena galopus ATCC 62051]
MPTFSATGIAVPPLASQRLLLAAPPSRRILGTLALRAVRILCSQSVPSHVYFMLRMRPPSATIASTIRIIPRPPLRTRPRHPTHAQPQLSPLPAHTRYMVPLFAARRCPHLRLLCPVLPPPHSPPLRRHARRGRATPAPAALRLARPRHLHLVLTGAPLCPLRLPRMSTFSLPRHLHPARRGVCPNLRIAHASTSARGREPRGSICGVLGDVSLTKEHRPAGVPVPAAPAPPARTPSICGAADAGHPKNMPALSSHCNNSPRSSATSCGSSREAGKRRDTTRSAYMAGVREERQVEGRCSPQVQVAGATASDGNCSLHFANARRVHRRQGDVQKPCKMCADTAGSAGPACGTLWVPNGTRPM